MYFIMDMGTTNTRLWLYDEGNELGFAKGAFGAKSGKLNGKEFLYGKVRELMLGLLSENGATEADVECTVVSGMAGSEGGICNIPHISLPAGEIKLASSVVRKQVDEIISAPFVFVPGLKQMAGDEIVDVMRGEEMESIGIRFELDFSDSAVLVLPGTHNKIIRMDENGDIVEFCTTMSGEILDLAVRNSLLTGSVSHDFTLVSEELFAGDRFARENGFNAALFHVRVMGMNGKSLDELSSFLYGAVLGQDAELIKRFAGDGKMYVGGKESLQKIYALLLGENAIAIPREISDFAVRDELLKIYQII